MPNEKVITQRIVLHRNGDPIHFDVTVDLARIALAIGDKAMRNSSRKSSVCMGAVKVEHVQ